MLSFGSLLTLGFFAVAHAYPGPPGPPGPSGLPGPKQSKVPTGCGEVDIVFTGLPPYHPLVTSQGFDPAKVDAALRGDAAEIVKAGYNLRVVLMGPEQGLDVLEERVRGVRWDGTGVGYGVRGSRLEELTIRLEDIISLYRKEAPKAPILFDHSPDSALWAIERKFPLSEDCTNSPGKDLGFELFCDICTDASNSTARLA